MEYPEQEFKIRKEEHQISPHPASPADSVHRRGDLSATEVDPVVEEAVRYINEKTIFSGLELARDIGDYILRHFFEGDFEKFTNPSRSKALSFRALLERQDLLLGAATLYVFVRISHHLKSLPDDVVSQLTLAQHRALLPLSDPESKVTLARQAIVQGWSSVVLREKVRKLLPRSRKGRKPLPPLVKKVRQVARVLDRPDDGALTTEVVRKLKREQARDLADQVADILERLNGLSAALNEVLERPSPDIECL